MRHLLRLLLFALIPLPVVTAVGCATTNTLETRAWQHEYPNAEPGQSLVLDRRGVTPDGEPSDAVLGTPVRGDGATLAWYADRNDRRPAVQVGVRSPTYEASTTHTVDRTSTHPHAGVHGGRPVVRQHYRSTTYTSRVQDVRR